MVLLKKKNDHSYGIRHHQQSNRYHIISISNKHFYRRCFENAENNKKERKKKVDPKIIRFPTWQQATADSASPTADKATDVKLFPFRIQINFFIWDVSKTRKKIKNKKQRKKRIRRGHPFRNDRQVTIDSQQCYSLTANKATEVKLFPSQIQINFLYELFRKRGKK